MSVTIEGIIRMMRISSAVATTQSHFFFLTGCGQLHVRLPLREAVIQSLCPNSLAPVHLGNVGPFRNSPLEPGAFQFEDRTPEP